MGYKGPCYSQPESSAATSARSGNATMANTTTLPQHPSTTQAGTGGYSMLPYLFQLQAYQPMGTPIPRALVFTPRLKVSLAHRGLFTTLAS
jgi:hypothetical protein